MPPTKKAADQELAEDKKARISLQKEEAQRKRALKVQNELAKQAANIAKNAKLLEENKAWKEAEAQRKKAASGAAADSPMLAQTATLGAALGADFKSTVHAKLFFYLTVINTKVHEGGTFSPSRR